MFWRVQGGEETSPIEKILNRDDYTLEEILLQEDCIQEVKSMNERLINYLKQPEVVSELISYILEPMESAAKLAKQQKLLEKQADEKLQELKLQSSEEGGEVSVAQDEGVGLVRDASDEEGTSSKGEDDADEANVEGEGGAVDDDETKENEEEEDAGEKALQSAYRVCEILCCEVDEIFTTIVTNPTENLGRLFSFLDKPAPLDSVLSGYYSRIMVSLVLRRPTDLTDYITENPEIVKKLVSHIYNYSITEFVLKLIGGDEQNAIYQGETTDWLSKTQLLDFLIDCVTSAEHNTNVSTVSNAASCIIGISGTAPSTLATTLQSPLYMDTLLQYLKTETPGDVLIAIIDILISILEPKQSKQAFSPDGLMSFGSYPPALAEAEVDESMIECANLIMKSIDQLASMLEEGADGPESFGTTYGVVNARLKMKRWKVLCLISKVVSIVDSTRCLTITKGPIVPRCFRLMYAMPFNSMLHNAVQSIMFGLIDKDSKDLLLSLMKDCRLHELLIAAEQETTNEGGKVALMKDKPLRSGYFGTVTTIANHALEMCTGDHVEVSKILEESAEWQAWMENVLLAQNKIEDPTSWQCGRPTRVNDIFGSIAESSQSTVDLSLYAGLTSDNDRYNDAFDDNEREDEEEDEEDSVYLQDDVDVVTSFECLTTEDGDTIFEEENRGGPMGAAGANTLDSALDDNVVLVASPEEPFSAQGDKEKSGGATDASASAEDAKAEREDTPAEYNSANFWRSNYDLILDNDP